MSSYHFSYKTLGFLKQDLEIHNHLFHIRNAKFWNRSGRGIIIKESYLYPIFLCQEYYIRSEHAFSMQQFCMLETSIILFVGRYLFRALWISSLQMVMVFSFVFKPNVRNWNMEVSLSNLMCSKSNLMKIFQYLLQ